MDLCGWGANEMGGVLDVPPKASREEQEARFRELNQPKE